MGIDWEAIARQIGAIDSERRKKWVGTEGGLRALEILLGQQNLRDAIDFWISLAPGAFTAENVLKIIRSPVAMKRCYEIYKTEPGTHRAAQAVGLLASFADERALPWVREFLSDSDRSVRWNGLAVLQNILYGSPTDADLPCVKELLDQADTDPDPETRDRAARVRLQLARHLPR